MPIACFRPVRMGWLASGAVLGVVTGILGLMFVSLSPRGSRSQGKVSNLEDITDLAHFTKKAAPRSRKPARHYTR
jgi:hypothetical protein